MATLVQLVYFICGFENLYELTPLGMVSLKRSVQLGEFRTQVDSSTRKHNQTSAVQLSQHLQRFSHSAQLSQRDNATMSQLSLHILQRVCQVNRQMLGHPSLVHSWHVYKINRYGNTPQWHLILGCFLPSTSQISPVFVCPVFAT